MSPTLFPLVLALTLSAAASATIPAAEDLADAQARAGKSNRPIVVNFYTDWCGYCRRMKKETYTDPRVIAMAEKDFVFLSLNAEDQGDGTRMARELGVGSFPTHVLLDADAEVLGQFSGFRDADGFITEVKRALKRQSKLDELLAKVDDPSSADPQTYFEMASALERGKRHRAAAEYYEKLLALDGETADRFRDLALWKLANLNVRIGKNELALSQFKRYVKSYPTTRKAETGLYQIGRLEQQEGRREAAIESYVELLRRYPDSRYALGVRMQLTFLEGK